MIYSNTGIGFACSHSSSPILLQHQYHGHCQQKIIMSCWISRPHPIPVVFLSHSLIHYLQQVEIPHKWDCKPGWI